MSAPTRGSARGRYVVIAGPDGTGKSTLASALISGVLGDAPALHLHHRPRVLGGLSTHEGPVTEPHRQPPYPRWLSTGKVLYLFLDHVLGWLLRLRPALRRGEHVVLERGWWDLVVDPRRYRLRPGPLAGALGRLLPRPDATVVLGGPAAAILDRSSELPVAELERQLRAWRQLPARSVRPAPVDVSQPLPAVVQAAAVALVTAPLAAHWVGLPRPGAPRWWLPQAPPRVAATGPLVYQPVTPRGYLGWHGVRVLARAGGLPLLPTARRTPPPELLALLAPHVPPGGHLAVARATHPGRLSALLIARDGTPSAFAKVALDAEGRASLAREARATTELGARCRPPLHVPEVLGSADGLLLLSPVAWRARRAPWALPVPVARALGRAFAAGADGSGLTHGDCAPWNLLEDRDADRWWLIDWADAAPGGAAFTDVLHYLVQGCAFLGRPSVPEVLAAVEGEGPLGTSVAAYAEAAEVPLSDAPAALAAYLAGQDEAGPGDRPEEIAATRVRAALLEALREGQG